VGVRTVKSGGEKGEIRVGAEEQAVGERWEGSRPQMQTIACRRRLKPPYTLMSARPTYAQRAAMLMSPLLSRHIVCRRRRSSQRRRRRFHGSPRTVRAATAQRERHNAQMAEV